MAIVDQVLLNSWVDQKPKLWIVKVEVYDDEDRSEAPECLGKDGKGMFISQTDCRYLSNLSQHRKVIHDFAI